MEWTSSTIVILLIQKKAFTETTFETTLRYRNASNKRPGRLKNILIFRGGVYSRGRLIEGGVYKICL